MKRFMMPLVQLIAPVLVVTLCSCAVDTAKKDSPGAASAAGKFQTFAYPVTRRVDQVDTYHGVRVADPYRWLENEQSSETQRWIQAQNALSQPYLEAIPAREHIKQRMTQLWNYERYDIPVT